MEDQHISQAEIDALINGLTHGAEPAAAQTAAPAAAQVAAPAAMPAAAVEAQPAAEPGLGKEDLPLLRDPLGNFIFQAVPALTELMGVQSEGGIADVSLATLKEVSNLGAAQVLVGRAALKGGLAGSSYYMIPMPFARMILKEMLQEDPPAELDDETLGKLAEELSKMNKCGLMELSGYLSQEVAADPVVLSQVANLAAAAQEPPETPALVVGIDMAVGDAMGRMLMIWPREMTVPLVQVARARQPKVAPKVAPAVVTPPEATAPVFTPPSAPAAPAAPVVQPARFPSLSMATALGLPRNIELLMDVRLKITVELGRTRRHIKDVLALGPGYVLELDRLANEQVDLLVNGKLVAKAEVVVVDENYGARVTEIISPEDRVEAMR